MKIIICVKSVPDPSYYNQIQMDSETKSLVRTNIPTVIGQSDLHALEEGLRLKDKFGAEVVVISMGPEAAKTQLYEALAFGADKAILLSDNKVAGSDTFSTSYVLSKVIETIGNFDLIIAGNESSDGATAHVPSQIGEWLNIPHAANVTNIVAEEQEYVIVNKKLDNGIGRYKMPTPAVLGVNASINNIRYMSVPSIYDAKNKPLEVWSTENLVAIEEEYIGLAGSPSQNGNLVVREIKKEVKMLSQRPEEIAEQLYQAIEAIRNK
ncbi:electron transfer flavoprotein subunit beta/FixA family protein [Streptococcus moroccensis]|uniref:Electron transfer flavoprotein small subunit n=1 Tax=Streptococcus moroccensis TaxID=1451356 RepID=A0ABT9YTN4_9STRE|nr:electron transfer flavoprotein subunit beta/FixA family protein [Streptococcus moroccensis]MDQ0223262.1 electron transfer flavoprotein beta subunit [Streptococcus moroccensis]